MQLKFSQEQSPEPFKKNGAITKKLSGILAPAVSTRMGHIAILTNLNSPMTGEWKQVLSQYGRIRLKYIEDSQIENDLTIVPDVNLLGDMPNSNFSSNVDLEFQQWFLNRTREEKNKRTIYCGRSGLIFAVNRNLHTIVQIKKKGLCPIKDESGNVYFVDADNCFGIRRYSVPDNARILYSTEIMNTQNMKESIIMGFQDGNNTILLFHPEKLINAENHEFFKKTQNRFGSETLYNSIYSSTL